MSRYVGSGICMSRYIYVSYIKMCTCKRNGICVCAYVHIPLIIHIGVYVKNPAKMAAKIDFCRG